MSKELEKLVKDATKVETLRKASSTAYHGLMTMQTGMEETMKALLKQNKRVGAETGYYAKLVREERGTQGVPYKQVIDDFIAQNPKYETQFAAIVKGYVTEKVTRVDYGKIEQNK